ncbi:hypothetical protein BDY19DRAFT_872341, partial [Irpex rosettiformis]
LSPADICCLCKTTRSFRVVFSRNLSRLYSVDRCLLRFFDNPSAFRVLQSQTGAIISGSFALQLFARTTFPDDDLDVYVGFGGRVAVGGWLLANGYQYTARPPYFQPDTNSTLLLDEGQSQDYATALNGSHLFQEVYHNSVDGVLNIMDFFRSTGGIVRKVQLHIVKESPLVAIMNYHSTMLMNFITYDMAYCLYPNATL